MAVIGDGSGSPVRIQQVGCGGGDRNGPGLAVRSLDCDRGVAGGSKIVHIDRLSADGRLCGDALVAGGHAFDRRSVRQVGHGETAALAHISGLFRPGYGQRRQFAEGDCRAVAIGGPAVQRVSGTECGGPGGGRRDSPLRDADVRASVARLCPDGGARHVRDGFGAVVVPAAGCRQADSLAHIGVGLVGRDDHLEDVAVAFPVLVLRPVPVIDDRPVVKAVPLDVKVRRGVAAEVTAVSDVSRVDRFGRSDRRFQIGQGILLRPHRRVPVRAFFLG